jgi:hypothetical protein
VARLAPLTAVLEGVPEGQELAVPFSAVVREHLACLHPDGGHGEMRVQVMAALSRTAVLEREGDGRRWLEQLTEVLVQPDRVGRREVSKYIQQQRAAGRVGRGNSRKARAG